MNHLHIQGIARTWYVSSKLYDIVFNF